MANLLDNIFSSVKTGIQNVGNFVSSVFNSAKEDINPTVVQPVAKPQIISSSPTTKLVNENETLPPAQSSPAPKITIPTYADPTKQNIYTAPKVSQPNLVDSTQTITPNPFSILTPKASSFLDTTKQTITNFFANTIQGVKQIVADPLNLQPYQRQSLPAFGQELYDKSIGVMVNALNSVTPSPDDFKQADAGFKPSVPGLDKTDPLKYSDELQTYQQRGNLADHVNGFLDSFNKTANLIFSPASAVIGGASMLPVVGTLANIVTTVFTGLGEAGSNTSKALVDPMIDQLPIGDDAKDQMKTNVNNIAALLYQTVGGSALHEVGTALKDSGAVETLKQTMTKNIITEYKLPQSVYFDPSKVKDIQVGRIDAEGNPKATSEETKLYASLGLTNEQIINAVKNGLTIEIPTEKVTTIMDKPVWANIKEAFGMTPGDIEKTTETIGDKTAKIVPRALLEEPKPGVASASDTVKYQQADQLSTKLLQDLQGREFTSRQYIEQRLASSDLNLKQVEKNIVGQVLENYPSDKIPVKEFAQKVKDELLPLERSESAGDIRTMKGGQEGKSMARYERISLPSAERGGVANYSENIYKSPIKTSAGMTHFPMRDDAGNYFGHTRVEDMSDSKTRRVIEVQSDLYQKGNLDKDFARSIDNNDQKSVEFWQKELKDNPNDQEAKDQLKFSLEAKKLRQYNDPTAHFRMVREEVKQAALDGKTKLQFPTGETAMKIEGLGLHPSWYNGNSITTASGDHNILGSKLTPDQLEVGKEVLNNSIETWVIIDVLGNGKFIAAPSDVLSKEGIDPNALTDASRNALLRVSETFDISGKIDTSSPIYKFYEKDLAKYLKSKYKAMTVIDKQGVTWNQIDIKPEMAKQPVEAFSPRNTGKDISIGQATKELYKLFTPEEVKFLAKDGLIKMPNGGVAFGKSAKGLIELVSNDGTIKDQTLYHEAFHQYAQQFLTAAERTDVLEEGIDMAKKEGVDGVKTLAQAEEYLADKFAEYVKDKSTFTGKIRQFFDNLLNTIKKMMGKGQKVLDTFNDILNNKRPTEAIKPAKDISFQEKKPEELNKKDSLNNGYPTTDRQELRITGDTKLPTTPDPKMIAEPKPMRAKVTEMDQNYGLEYAYNLENPKAGRIFTINALSDEAKSDFQKWVNAKRTIPTMGYAAAKPFKVFDKEGIDGFLRFNAGFKEGMKPVEEYFDKRYKDATNLGIDMGFKYNYLPQIWNNTAAEILKAYQNFKGTALGLRPAFSLEAVFKDYAEGMKAGLTPKFKNISQLINWYEQRFQKAKADIEYYNKLAKVGAVQPSNSVEENPGWSMVDPERWPQKQIFYTGSDGIDRLYQGTMSAPTPLATLINNNLRPGSALLRAPAAVMGKLKGVVMSVGIPGTSINPHGVNMLGRAFLLSTKHPSIGVAALKYMFWPNSGKAYIDANMDQIIQASKLGLTISNEDHEFNPIGTKVLEPPKTVGGKAMRLITSAATKIDQTLYSAFGKNTFQKMIPALKIRMWMFEKADLMKKGMTEETAGKTAAITTNNFLSGKNIEQIGRNKDFQNLLRTFVFAPDFAETGLEMGGKTIASATPWTWKNPKYNIYRTAGITLIGAYIAMNFWNKKTSGKYMFENPSGHQFDVFIGNDANGKDVWFRPFGSSVDFARLPLDIIAGIKAGDLTPLQSILMNRVSVGVQLIGRPLFNTDPFGNNIVGRDKYGQKQTVGKQLGNLATTELNTVLPGSIDAIIKKSAGLSNAQVGAEALGLPLKFNAAGASSQQIQDMRDQATAEIKTGNYTTFNQLIKEGVILPKDRTQFIRNALKPQAIKDIIKQRAANRLKQEKAGVNAANGKPAGADALDSFFNLIK